jgi:asparagine N-glycosylation enzyme membrane subunit Stt3
MRVTVPALREAARRAGVLSNVDAPRPRTRTSRRDAVRRAAACGVVALTGFALLVPNLAPLTTPGTPAVGVALSVASSVVCVALVAVAAALYRSGFSTRNTVRIAAWNLLGVVVLGGVMLALLAYQRTAGLLGDSHLFAVSSLLSVGALAHVIIGVYDARRVRAEQLARERRRISVLNRVLRHNSRTTRT